MSDHWPPSMWISWKVWSQLPKPPSTLDIPSQEIAELMRARRVPLSLDYRNATDIQRLHQLASGAAEITDIATIRELEVGLEFFTDITHDLLVVDVHRNTAVLPGSRGAPMRRPSSCRHAHAAGRQLNPAMAKQEKPQEFTDSSASNHRELKAHGAHAVKAISPAPTAGDTHAAVCAAAPNRGLIKGGRIARRRPQVLVRRHSELEAGDASLRLQRKRLSPPALSAKVRSRA
jgi:hypothetical protein